MKWGAYLVRFLAGAAAGLFLLFMLSVAYDAGSIVTQKKVARQIAASAPPLLYDVAFYNKSEMKLFTIPADPTAIHIVPGSMETCLVIERPQFRVYCGLVAFYPCTRECMETK